jgi:hypothetical protein
MLDVNVKQPFPLIYKFKDAKLINVIWWIIFQHVQRIFANFFLKIVHQNVSITYTSVACAVGPIVNLLLK